MRHFRRIMPHFRRIGSEPLGSRREESPMLLDVAPSAARIGAAPVGMRPKTDAARDRGRRARGRLIMVRPGRYRARPAGP
jgi:hypothetical protein